MAYREQARRCPSCRAPMREVAVPDGEAVDLCDPCGGIFVEFFDGEPRAIVDGIALGDDVSIEGAATCPDCHVPMVRRRYLEHGPSVLRCGGCLAMWVTPDELRRVAYFKAPRPAPLPWTSRLRALVATLFT